MSRRSLYKSGRHHTVQYGTDVDSTVVHYRFGETALLLAGDDSVSVPQNKFQVKTWLRIDDSEYKQVVDGIEGDVLVLPSAVPHEDSLASSETPLPQHSASREPTVEVSEISESVGPQDAQSGESNTKSASEEPYTTVTDEVVSEQSHASGDPGHAALDVSSTIIGLSAAMNKPEAPSTTEPESASEPKAPETETAAEPSEPVELVSESVSETVPEPVSEPAPETAPVSEPEPEPATEPRITEIEDTKEPEKDEPAENPEPQPENEDVPMPDAE